MAVVNPYKNEESNYMVPDEFCCKISLVKLKIFIYFNLKQSGYHG